MSLIEAVPGDGKKVHSKAIKEFLVNEIRRFTTTKQQGQKLLQWLRAGAILQESKDVNGDVKKTKVLQLNKNMKQELLRGIFPLPGIERSTKFQMLDKVLGKDKTDKAILTRLYCKAALPDPEEKKQAWREITN